MTGEDHHGRAGGSRLLDQQGGLSLYVNVSPLLTNRSGGGRSDHVGVWVIRGDDLRDTCDQLHVGHRVRPI